MGALIGWMALVAAAAAAQVELVSRTAVIQDSNGHSVLNQVSADGRYVVFTSKAANLVPGQIDRNGLYDVFLHDRVAGTTLLVSRAAGDHLRTGNGNCDGVEISADARYIAFRSESTNLVQGQVDAFRAYQEDYDLFLFDRVAETMVLVSHTPGSSVTALGEEVQSQFALSANGSSLAYTTIQQPHGQDFRVSVFLYQRSSGEPVLVAGPLLVDTTVDALSADGFYLAFSSSDWRVLPGVTDEMPNRDVFLYHRPTRTTKRVSHASGQPSTEGDGSSSGLSLSADGRYLLFSSVANNLVPGQISTGGGPFETDAFLYDRVTDSTILVSRRKATPTTEAGGVPFALTPDGRHVVFGSMATNLVPGQVDTTATFDLFLWDRTSGDVQLINRSHRSPQTPASHGEQSNFPSISADGCYVAFVSTVGDLIAGENETAARQVFLFDATSGTISLASHAGTSGSTPADAFSSRPILSDDGRILAFSGPASDVGEAQVDTVRYWDVFVHETRTGANTVISSRDPGSPSVTPTGSSSVTALSPSQISADGRFLLFLSKAPDIVPGIDNSVRVDDVGAITYEEDAFLYDRVERKVTLVNHAAGSRVDTGHGGVDQATLSADGRYVAFSSPAADLVAGAVDENGAYDVFLFDRVTGETALVSRARGSQQRTADRGSANAVISADGRYVTFASEATNLVPGQLDANSGLDVFVWNRVTGETALVSHAAGASARTASDPSGNRFPRDLAISADGRFITFISGASDLLPGQSGASDSYSQLFLYDRTTGINTLVTHAAGSPTVEGEGGVQYHVISADGRFVAFESLATNLVPGQTDTNEESDLFLFDRVGATTTLVSHSASSPVTAGNGKSFNHYHASYLSADGRYITFVSTATDLAAGVTIPHRVPFDPDAFWEGDVYLYDRVTRTTTLVSHSASSPLLGADNAASLGPTLSADGRYIVYSSLASDLVNGVVDGNELSDVFRYDRVTGTTSLISRSLGSAALTASGWSVNPVLSSDGQWTAFNSSAADLIAGDFNSDWDVFLSGLSSGTRVNLPVCRLLDSRRAADGPAFASGRVEVVQARGACGIPATATAIFVRVLVLRATAAGELAFYPADAASGTPAARMAFPAGPRRARRLTLPLSAEGLLTLRSTLQGQGRAHVVVEVNGYRQ